MKGLLLKDFYMMRKYCRSYLFIVALFVAVSFFGSDNLLFVFYPCLLCGMIPVNLLAYDEQSRFISYAGTLPYTKAQIVSGKYIIAIITQCAVLMLTAATQGIKMAMGGTLHMQDYLVMLIMGFCVTSVVAPISLPFMFKFGTEKGRMAYFLMMGVVFAVVYGLSTFIDITQASAGISISGFLPIICAVCVGIYAISWCLSITFYKKREI